MLGEGPRILVGSMMGSKFDAQKHGKTALEKECPRRAKGFPNRLQNGCPGVFWDPFFTVLSAPSSRADFRPFLGEADVAKV